MTIILFLSTNSIGTTRPLATDVPEDQQDKMK